MQNRFIVNNLIWYHILNLINLFLNFHIKIK